ncbi:MAG: ABC transporter permease [Candidatus Schekmanbacteria bacterium]|nr:ABC transporter permease [Candidatus Schekmanbacteria bacterium]
MWTTYETDRRGPKAWALLSSMGRGDGQMAGVLSLIGGAVIIASFALAWLIATLGLAGLSDRTNLEQVYEPPALTPLKWLLDQRDVRASTLFGAPPQAEGFHVLGTDGAGRDILSLLVLGTRTYLVPGLLAVSIALGLGILLGTIHGHYGGYAAKAVSWFVKTVHSVPKLLLLLVIGAVTDFDVKWLMFGLGFAGAPRVTEMVAARIASLRRADFIEAAREAGLREWVIVAKHVLWYNCRHLLVIQASFFMAEAILMETTLSYLNSGAQGLSWGRMVQHGSNDLFQGIYWTSAAPAAAVVTTILGFYLLGDGLNRIQQS